MSQERINPWLSMWIHPRKTMRYILDHYPKRWIHTLAIAGAFTHVASSANFYWETWWASLLFWLFLSVLAGLITLYVFGGLIKWTGNWLKGKGRFQDVLSAIAWAQIPVIYFFIIDQAILVAMGGVSSNLLYASLRFVFAIWGFVVFLCCLQEAQNFSFFRSLINYVLSIIILVLFLLILNVAINFFAKPAFDSSVQTTEQMNSNR